MTEATKGTKEQQVAIWRDWAERIDAGLEAILADHHQWYGSEVMAIGRLAGYLEFTGKDLKAQIAAYEASNA